MTAIGKLALAVPLAAAVWAQGYFVPGDPKAGMRIFAGKGCMRCHAVLGEGGCSAPDLAKAPAGHLSSAELVSAMWNHAPEMWRKMRLERVAEPRFGPDEMMNLFAFLYSVRSLDEPGDAERGRRLLDEKHCLECHAVAGRGAGAAPDLEQWAGYRNPVSWIQAMWNHGPAMQSGMARRGFEWPQFAGNDVSDLIAYIRTLAANPPARAQLRNAEPERGRAVFAAKHCDRCHTFGGRGRGPDLGARELPRTLGQFAGAMWNHGPQMWNSMRAGGLARPRFSNQEMADLIAYLFTARYFDSGGQAAQGRRIFAEKGCAGCHAGGTAPDLRTWRGRAAAAPLAAALWNHGLHMFTRMQEHRLSWPRFRPGEMADLLEYLNREAGASPAAGGQP